MADLTPNNRQENWYKGIVDGSTTLTPNNRREYWYQGMIDGSTDLTPNNRREAWYKAIVDSKGGGGGSSDFGLFTLTFDLSIDPDDPDPPNPAAHWVVGYARIDYPPSNLESPIYECDELFLSQPSAPLLAYKGYAYFVSISAVDEDYNVVGIEDISFSDNLYFDEDLSMYVLTGDATLSGKLIKI